MIFRATVSTASPLRRDYLAGAMNLDPLLIATLCAGLFIRIIYTLPRHIAFGDEACYLWLAENLFSGRGYTYHGGQPELHFPPLFPIALGLLKFIVRDLDLVSRVAYVLFGSLLPLLAYLLGKEMYGKRPALLAAFLIALAPVLTTGVIFAGTMSEPLYLVCLWGGAYYAFRAAVDQEIPAYAASGALLSLAYLTRPEGMVFFASVFVYLALVIALWRPVSWKRAATRLVIYTVAFLVVASPYVVYLTYHTGKVALTTKDTTSYTTTRGLVDRDEVAFQRDTWGLNEAGEIKYFAKDQGENLFQLLSVSYKHRVLNDVKENLESTWSYLKSSWVLGLPLIALGIIGFFGSPWKGKRMWAEVLNLFLIAPLAAFLIFFVRERQLYGSLLPFFLWSAVGFEIVLTWAHETDWPGFLSSRGARTVMQVLLVAVAAGYLVKRGHDYFHRHNPASAEVVAAAQWLKENTPPNAVVMAAGPEVAFHARRRWCPLPYADREQVVAYARKHQATHIAIRGKYLVERPGQRDYLFDQAATSDELELLVRSGKLPPVSDDPEKRKNPSSPKEPSFAAYRIKDPPARPAARRDR